MTQKLTEDQVIKIAKNRAIADPYVSFFKNPYIDSVVRQTGTDNWVVKILSEKPTDQRLGSMYMYIIIDKTNGEIISVDLGGGS